jgi:hypothetical protein
MNDTSNALTAAITTMVSGELHGADRDGAAASQAAEAEAELAPVLKVMNETGLAASGYKAALVRQMPAVHWDPGGVPRAARHQLILARDLIRDRVEEPLIPDAVIVYGHAVMFLLGDPDVGSVSSQALNGTGWQLC